MDKKIIILYHSDCIDGFGVAWTAFKKFGSHAEYIPVRHYDVPPHNAASFKIDSKLPLPFKSI